MLLKEKNCKINVKRKKNESLRIYGINSGLTEEIFISSLIYKMK